MVTALAMGEFIFVTNMKKKKASSNEFWNRMMWMRIRMILGLWNQKWSSEGWTTKSPSMATCFSATSLANWLITCSSFVPTASKSCEEARYEFSIEERFVRSSTGRETRTYHGRDEGYVEVCVPTCTVPFQCKLQVLEWNTLLVADVRKW